jgi:hypothetical protein
MKRTSISVVSVIASEARQSSALTNEFPLHMAKLPFALSLSKGMSEWAQGFDKLSPNG